MSNQGNSNAAPPPPASGKSGMSCLMIGCLSVIVLGVLACGGMSLGLWMFGDDIAMWGIDKGKTAIIEQAGATAQQAVRESQLPEQDKQVISEQIDRVARAYDNEEISTEEVLQVLNTLVAGPWWTMGAINAVEQKWIAPSGLSEEEKAQARRTTERTIRGLAETKISQTELENSLEPITTTDAEGNRKLKQNITDEELRLFLAEAKQIADNAGIPDEPFQVNIGDEVKKAVDSVLNKP